MSRDWWNWWQSAATHTVPRANGGARKQTALTVPHVTRGNGSARYVNATSDCVWRSTYQSRGACRWRFDVGSIAVNVSAMARNAAPHMGLDRSAGRIYPRMRR